MSSVLYVPASKNDSTIITLTDEQAEDLALGPDQEHLELLGCGEMACAYAANDGRVVKFTKDSRDALASYILSNLPAAGEGWAIPIHAVYHLEQPKNYFVIVAERAGELSEEGKAAIDAVYEAAGKVGDTLLKPEVWKEFVAAARATGCAPGEAEALEVIDRAVRGFHRLGLEWIDFHSGNFGVYGGDVVAIDLGMSFPVDMPPADLLDRAGVEAL